MMPTQSDHPLRRLRSVASASVSSNQRMRSAWLMISHAMIVAVTYRGVPLSHFPRSCRDTVFSDTPSNAASRFCWSPARLARTWRGSLSTASAATGGSAALQAIIVTVIFLLASLLKAS